MPNYAAARDFKSSLRTVFADPPPPLELVRKPRQTIIDGATWRALLISGRVLREVTALASPPSAALPMDADGFVSVATEIVWAHGVPAAREIADAEPTDPRVAEQLNRLLALPAADRDVIVGRHRSPRSWKLRL